MSNKLKLWFDKNINDIKGCLPNGEKGRWDIYLLFNAFLGIKILDDNNLITELKNRGYDISTIKFEITKKNSEIQSVTTKDLTLDMWDKSIVNKIKRLEKSIELNNKVKKDLKKQIDQLKQQLAEKDGEINIKNNKLCELKKQLQNCQNEIIKLKTNNKNLMSIIWKTKRERANKGRQVCQSQNESIKYKKLLDKSEQNQKLLAIQELGKTLNFIENVFDKALKNCSLNNVYYDQILDFIDQQIKLLKGEKDVKD